MIKCYFPIHLDAGNRGCEAIDRGTVEILECKKNEYIGFCTDINLDCTLQLDDINILIPAPRFDLKFRLKTKMTRMLTKKQYHDAYISVKYSGFLKRISTNDICFITGGDMFCYGDNELNYIIDYMAKRNITTVLWGCSFGPENLTPAKKNTLDQITAITARESLTYDYFVNELGMKKVKLVSDPAFTLEPQKCELSNYFKNNVIGINLSNFTSEKYSDENLFFNSFMGLIEYIICNTDLTIVLIPHVFWEGQDDRIVCNLIKEKASKPDRIKILNTEEMNYCQIRFAISKCRYFIGARTHAMISAYSTCTPSIALGYSIKARGIAKDLGLDERLVIDFHNVHSSDELIERFEYLIQNEKQIKGHLQSVIPNYTKKAYLGKEVIEKLKKRIEENMK